MTTVSTIDFLQVVSDTQPELGQNTEATIRMIHQKILENRPGTSLTSVGKARDLAVGAGLVTKTGYNHRLTRKGKKELSKNEATAS